MFHWGNLYVSPSSWPNNQTINTIALRVHQERDTQIQSTYTFIDSQGNHRFLGTHSSGSETRYDRSMAPQGDIKYHVHAVHYNIYTQSMDIAIICNYTVYGSKWAPSTSKLVNSHKQQKSAGGPYPMSGPSLLFCLLWACLLWIATQKAAMNRAEAARAQHLTVSCWLVWKIERSIDSKFA